MRYFFKQLVNAPEFLNGSIVFDQGYINNNILSGKYNVTYHTFSLKEAISGWAMIHIYGIFFNKDISACIIIFISF